MDAVGVRCGLMLLACQVVANAASEVRFFFWERRLIEGFQSASEAFHEYLSYRYAQPEMAWATTYRSHRS